MAAWTDDQGCHLYALFYAADGIGMCGCGQPDAAIDTIRRLLDLHPPYDHQPELTSLFHGDPGLQHLTLSMLDRAGLTEHGGSVHGAWLTAKGRAARYLLAQVPPGAVDDALDEYGFPHDGDCPGDCWAQWDPGDPEDK